MTDLSELFKVVAEGKKKYEETDPKGKIIKQVKQNVKEDLSAIFDQLSALTTLKEELQQELAVEEAKQEEMLVEDILTEVEVPEVKPASQIHSQAEIDKYLKRDASFQQPDPDVVGKNVDEIRNKIKFLEKAIGRIAATGPGSGEVNFRWLDDVNRATMTDGNDNWVLEYDAATKKVQFTKDIGPIDSVMFDTNHDSSITHPVGTLSWNTADNTLNLQHSNARQQIGQEQYFPPVVNLTGSTIPNGTVCMFAGAEEFNNARLLTAPMVADGTYPSLYVMGVATHDIPDGGEGFVTSFGYVNDLNTSMWNKGDILYTDPFNPGGMTNVKPTAPNNCIPIAAVVKKHATTGRIMVRPTVEQKMLYGRFSDSTDQSPDLPNHPHAITFNTTEVARGFHVDGNGLPTSTVTCEESGFYNIAVDLSLTSSNSSSKAFFVWLRKNGVDVPNSARRQSVSGNGTYQNLMYATTISLAKNDTIEIMYAVSDVTISINSPPATAFCPAIPSVSLLITQVAL